MRLERWAKSLQQRYFEAGKRPEWYKSFPIRIECWGGPEVHVFNNVNLISQSGRSKRHQWRSTLSVRQCMPQKTCCVIKVCLDWMAILQPWIISPSMSYLRVHVLSLSKYYCTISPQNSGEQRLVQEQYMDKRDKRSVYHCFQMPIPTDRVLLLKNSPPRTNRFLDAWTPKDLRLTWGTKCIWESHFSPPFAMSRYP